MIIIAIFFLPIVLAFIPNQDYPVFNDEDLGECKVIQRFGPVSGLSLYASRDFFRGEVIESGVTAQYSCDDVEGDDLVNDYGYGSTEKGYKGCNLVLGHIMILNNRNESNVEVVSHRLTPRLGRYGAFQSKVRDFLLVAKKSVKLGTLNYLYSGV